MMANAALMRKVNGDVNLDDVEDAGDQKRRNSTHEVYCEANFDTTSKMDQNIAKQWQ